MKNVSDTKPNDPNKSKSQKLSLWISPRGRGLKSKKVIRTYAWDKRSSDTLLTTQNGYRYPTNFLERPTGRAR